MKEQKLNLSKSRIEHMFKKEMSVPWCSVHDNITLMMASEKLIVTSDDKTCKVEKFEHYHILSDYAEVLVKRLYGVTVDAFMKMWYKRMLMMDSMWFIYLKVEEVKNGEVGEV